MRLVISKVAREGRSGRGGESSSDQEDGGGGMAFRGEAEGGGCLEGGCWVMKETMMVSRALPFKGACHPPGPY